MAKVDAFLQLMASQGSSQLHLEQGQQPGLIINGQMERVKYKALDESLLQDLLREVLPSDKAAHFESGETVEFEYTAPGIGALKCRAGKDPQLSLVFELPGNLRSKPFPAEKSSSWNVFAWLPVIILILVIVANFRACG